MRRSWAGEGVVMESDSLALEKISEVNCPTHPGQVLPGNLAVSEKRY